MYDKLFPPKKLVLANGKVIMEKRSRLPFIFLILAVLTATSTQLTDFDIQMLFDRINQFFIIIGEMVPPKWSYFPHLWDAMISTLQMSFLGSIIGAALALPFAMMASSNVIRNKSVVAVFKIMLSLLRTLPTLVTALIATYVFGLGPMAGLVAIMLFTLSYVGKLVYEQIENVDMGSFEAMESIGMNRVEAFRYSIYPQVLSRYLSTSLFCFEGNVRYAAILGYVGAGGIGLLIHENIGWRDYSRVGMIILSLIVTVFVIETISEHFRKKLT
ncbi:phosphonate ABC transporter, permease protein PhnE [Paenibacillus sp. J45TS6]|uniref:phosphonate ABC transporter, permease protein PhnE n=1 Tax=Paenibacillus sp. J45TS6 TaxID=2807196 RepID=UPI001B04808E|nr:phosphonate ABC transporter, permease protein PhnE [Paenibacillus sp. J45TS6]GIP44731.1 phosphonate ABC transporter, permease protein PhnE [Paenibacillus sp. J45TS6]